MNVCRPTVPAFFSLRCVLGCCEVAVPASRAGPPADFPFHVPVRNVPIKNPSVSRLLISLVALSASILAPVAEAGPSAPQQARSGQTARRDEQRAERIAAPTTLVLQAHAIAGAVNLDGLLDEVFWREAEEASGFTQREPEQGEPATEETLVQVIYTEDTLYIGVRALDSDPSRIMATEMQRDGSQSFSGGRLDTDDSIVVLLDTFHDGRNAFHFETNSWGARADALITDEGRNRNFEWDGVWNAAARRTEEGWSAEMAIPFNTLRFNPDLDTWGFQVRRLIRHKNEEVFWAPIMRDADLFRVSRYGQLTGLSGGRPTRNLRVKPFVTGSGSEGIESEVGDLAGEADVGLDVRWGVTDSLTLDVTVNTDFAQVEVDEQQVNLTRFSLFFPEKREFFLENAGIFEFGPGRGGSGGGFRAPLLKVYHSRRIGIAQGEQIPIIAGGKLTGRAGDWNIGLLNVQTNDTVFPDLDDEVPTTNWAVVRVTRNVGARSNLGVIFTNRQVSGDDFNRVVGVDADINPHPRLNLNGFFTASDDPGNDSDNWAAAAGAGWQGPVWRWSGSYTEIRENYNPEVGFLLRRGIRQFNPQVTWEPRPASIDWIRSFTFETRNTIITRTDGTLETYEGRMRFFGLRTAGEDWISFSFNPTFERLFEDFEIQPGIIVPPGDYTFYDWSVFMNTNEGRLVSTHVRLNVGELYDGDRIGSNISVNFRPSAYFRSRTEWNRDDIDLPGGDFVTTIWRQRFNVSFSPNVFLNSFIQYSDTDELLSMNTRFNWIYKPGADLFIVYNQNWLDGNNRDRALIFKFTYLWAL